MAKLRISVIRPVEDSHPVTTNGDETFQEAIVGVQITGTLDVLLSRAAEVAERAGCTDAIAIDLVLDLRSDRAVAHGSEAAPALGGVEFERLVESADWAQA